MRDLELAKYNTVEPFDKTGSNLTSLVPLIFHSELDGLLFIYARKILVL